ncbi:MAG TPA: FAD-dependent oxidoreductase [Thermoanaerobaculia bacterium]|nr:FAD-dependent oxidoreductase [Thermoanaerobaculia bacterium]
MRSKSPTRLLLVGAGHAHLEILRRQASHPQAHVDLTLVSVADCHHYSGMVPGFLQGQYEEREITFDLPALAEKAGGRFVQAKAVALDPTAREVRLEGGGTLGYDLVSFNVGSRSAGDEDEAVRRHAARVKPMSRVAELRRRLGEMSGENHVVIVGGGAAGVEIACAIATFLDEAGCRRRITIVEGSGAILSDYSKRFRRRAEAVLAGRDIAVRTGIRVETVETDAVRIKGGALLRSDLTVWLTGAAAWPLFESSGLPVDRKGFLLVDDSLRSIADPRIFGAGDCVTPERYPDTPKAGVYAVREAPVLWQSLVAAIEGGKPPRYKPQGGFLSLLNTGDGKALLRYKSLVSHSRWAWRLKDRIDRGFMKRYQ